MLHTLSIGLAERGHDVELILLENRINYLIPPDVKVSCLTHKKPRGWFGKRYLAYKLKKHIKRSGGADIIISALPFANEVAVLANLKNHWCRVDNTLCMEIKILEQQDPKKAKRRWLRYNEILNSRPIIAISDGMVSDLRNCIKVTSRIEKITNPFDFEGIKAAARVRVRTIPNDKYVIHVGRFNKQKRHDLLIDAWARTSTEHILVLLVEENKELRDLIKLHKQCDRVFVAGFQDNPYSWMANADLLVLSSDFEGLSNVIVEALICGTPVVSTDCPSGPGEILHDFPDSLVVCNDADKLAVAIEKNLNSHLDISMINIERFKISNVLDLHEKLAREEIGKG